MMNWNNVCNVRLDPFHAMKRISDVLSTNHPLFTAKLRDANFVINPDDKRNVTSVLERKGISFESKILISVLKNNCLGMIKLQQNCFHQIRYSRRNAYFLRFGGIEGKDVDLIIPKHITQ
jgi:hypothetical protein